MTSWMPYSTGMPSVRVNDLQINYATSDIWAATYGRSLWKSRRQIFGSYPLAVSPLAPGHLTITPNPSHGEFTITLGSNTQSGSLSAKLTDAEGRTVWQKQLEVTGNTIPVKINGVASGIYFMELSDGGAVIGRNKVVID